MSNLIYNTGIKAYKTGVKVARLLGNEKAKKWLEGREGWQEELQSFREGKESRPLIWLHASSLGEFEQVKPLIERIKSTKEFDDYLLVVTFFSPSGYENSLTYDKADLLFYLPADTPNNAQRFLDILNPDIAIFVKYDFWFNILDELQKRLTPIVYFSCNFREGQLFFKPYGKWQRSILQGINAILTLNQQSKEILEKNDFENVKVCGDTRFDKVIDNAEKCTPVPIVEKFKDNKPLLIVGSSWQPEEKIIADFVNNNQELKVIIAPHDISEKHLKEIESIVPVAVRYSRVTEENVENTNVILIDNIGLLSNLYQYADFAFIGGGFTNDLHNILEAAVFGNVVFFGNKHSKYPEGRGLIEYGGAIEVKDSKTFTKELNRLLIDINKRKEIGGKAKHFVERHKGATDIVFEEVKRLI